MIFYVFVFDLEYWYLLMNCIIYLYKVIEVEKKLDSLMIE